VDLLIECKDVEGKKERGALLVLGQEVDKAAELLDDLLADAEPKTDSFWVEALGLMLDRGEELEHLALVSSFDADPVVCNGDTKLVIEVEVGAADNLNENSDLSIASSKLESVAIEIQEYLLQTLLVGEHIIVRDLLLSKNQSLQALKDCPHVDCLHICLVALYDQDLINGLSYIEDGVVLGEEATVLVHHRIVQDVVDKEVDELRS